MLLRLLVCVILRPVIAPTRVPLLGRTIMSTDMPATLADEIAETAVEVNSAQDEWTATALTVALAAAAVLFVSFLAVVTGLV
jgi:hypothetical protein